MPGKPRGVHPGPCWKTRCRNEPLWFIESNLVISSKDGGLIPFRLNGEQKIVYKKWLEQWERGEPVRLIVLKARQLGISTLFESLIYWATSTRESHNSLILSNDVESASHILTMSQTFYDHDVRHKHGCLPLRNRNNSRSLEFANPNRFDRVNNPGLGSKIIIGTADTRSTGRSRTLQALHLSEVAFWASGKVVAAALNALARGPQTMGFMESTANGGSGYFYETWKAAERAVGEWTPIFLSWKGRPEYRIDLTDQQREVFLNTMSLEERTYMEEYGLAAEEMAWRRRKIESYTGAGRDPRSTFDEEYPIVPSRAFQTTGRNYFSMKAVDDQELIAKNADYVDGYLDARWPGGGHKPTEIFFVHLTRLMAKPCMVRRWRQPVDGADYVIGADVALGFSEGDYSVAYCMRRDTAEVVARIRGQIEPDQFSEMLLELAWYYNEAFLAPENNSIGMAVAKKTASRYSRHAYQMDISSPGDPKYDLSKPGWHTSVRNRKEMYAYLRQCIRDSSLHIWDEDFFEECRNFIVPEEIATGRMREDKPRAIVHRHDDCVAAMAITLQANDPMLAGPIRRKTPIPETALDWRKSEQARVEKMLMDAAGQRATDVDMGAYI